MFDDPHKRTFFNAPQSVTTFVAALLEPGISVLTYVLATLAFDPPLVRKDMVVCMLVLALTFPGRNRFRDSLLGAAVDIASSWLILLGILALCAFATQMQGDFNQNLLLTWALTTPILQWHRRPFPATRDCIWKQPRAGLPFRRKRGRVTRTWWFRLRIAQGMKFPSRELLPYSRTRSTSPNADATSRTIRTTRDGS